MISRITYGIAFVGAMSVCVPRAWATSADRLIFPDPQHRIVIAVADSCDSDLPCGRTLSDADHVAQLIQKDLLEPFHQSLVKVCQALRNYVGDTLGPNILYASTNEGGFARQGIALVDNGSFREFPDLRYVDLVLTPERLAEGAMDIYSHELGHVMMSYVWPDRWEGWSPKQHVSMGITDDYVALSEGWGIHFQQLAVDNVPRYERNLRLSQAYPYDVFWLWHSRLDTRLRLEGVKDNDYIHRKLLPDVDTTGMSPTDLIFLEHTSPNFDHCRLRNGAEMMASEGVIATLFYRMSTDSILRYNYGDLDFYRPFLLHDVPDDTPPESLFSPFENVLLKSAAVWRVAGARVDSTSAPFVEIIKTWGELFPEDRREILSLFISTTVGRTVCDDAATLYERAALAGMIGRAQEFRPLRNDYRDTLKSIIQDVVEGCRHLDDNLGPQLWIENPDLEIPVSIFFPEPVSPLWINLNTAGAFELASFADISRAQAQRILAIRDSVGYFRTLDDARVAGFSQ